MIIGQRIFDSKQQLYYNSYIVLELLSVLLVLLNSYTIHNYEDEKF